MSDPAAATTDSATDGFTITTAELSDPNAAAANDGYTAAEAATPALNCLDQSGSLSAAHMEFHKKLDALPDLSPALRRELEAHTLKYATELDFIVENFHYRNNLGWRRM